MASEQRLEMADRTSCRERGHVEDFDEPRVVVDDEEVVVAVDGEEVCGQMLPRKLWEWS